MQKGNSSMRIDNVLWTLTLVVLVSGCNDRPCCQNVLAPVAATNRDVAPKTSAPVHAVFDESIHTRDIPYLDEMVAPGPHRDVYQKSCSVCHTTRYISMQPMFPE